MKRYFIKILFLALAFGCIGLNINRAQDAKMPSGWKKISNCETSFFVPKEFEDDNGGESSSCAVASWKSGEIVLVIDYGFDGKPSQKSETNTEFKEETIIIDGKKAQFATYKQLRPDDKTEYVARIYRLDENPDGLEEGELMSFRMTLISPNKKDLKIAKRIFQSLRHEIETQSK